MEPSVDRGAVSFHEPALAAVRNSHMPADWQREVPSHNKVY